MQNLSPAEFFDVLFEGANGYLAIATFPGNGKFNRNKGPTRTAWFHWPSDRDKITAFVLSVQQQDLYTVPMLFADPANRKGENVRTGRVVYADADDCHPANFRLEPTMIVQTSPGHHQVYWVIEDIGGAESSATAPQILSRMARRVALAHKDQGCDASGWDVGQLLRVPGSTNNKPDLDEPHTVRAQSKGHIYALSTFEEKYPAVQSAEDHQVLDHPQPADDQLPTVQEALQLVSGHSEIMELYRTQCKPDTGRYQRMWRLLGLMCRSHLPMEAAFVIAWDAGCNKYRQDNRPAAELWRELVKAYSDPANTHESTGLSDAEMEVWNNLTVELEGDDEDPFREAPAELNQPQPGSAKADMFVPVPDAELTEGFTGFLSDVERSSHVPRYTIVDRYVAWAAKRTDAPAAYQRAGVLTVLSTIFGDFAYPATKFPMGGLNLWFMMLGGTTRSRKSTARRMMLNTLAMLENDQYTYDLGSDATAEGLALELADHPGRSMLFHRDEVHGLFSETQQKSYLAGFKESLTELYDGHVRGRLRATGDKRTNSERTVFNMFLSGITSDITTEMTPRDFASGFLTRFLFVHADPPPRTRSAVYMEQADGGGQNIDHEHEALVADLGHARGYWERMTNPGHQVPLAFSDEAWDRLNTFVWDLTVQAEDHKLSEMLAPSADRMSKSTMKIACLLAMVEREMEVGMPHLLKAVSLAEEWYSHLIEIAAKVRESQWQQQQEEVTKELATLPDPVAQNKLYAKVRGRYKPREFEELMQALENGGVIARQAGGHGMMIQRVGW